MERELLLLGVLRHGEMHGYQLHDFIEKNMAFCTDLKKPTAYFLLDKMQENGWVKVKEARDGNRPQKRIYKLTPKGEAAFLELLRDNLAGFSSAKTGSDIGLAFVDALSPDEAQTFLLQRRNAVAAQIAEFEEAPAHAGSYQLLIDHQLHYLRSELEWLNLVIRRVKAKARAQH
jgi:DNA-binding PadR family transcriptional regulator